MSFLSSALTPVRWIREDQSRELMFHFPTGIAVILMLLHGHSQALFFAAAPEDLGLTKDYGFSPSKPYLPIPTTSIEGFRTNDDAKKFFMSHLASAQASYDLQHKVQSAAPRAGGECGYPDAACVKARPEIICQVHGAMEVVPEPDSSLLKAPAAERVKVSSTGTSAADAMSLDQSQGRAWHTDSAYDRRSPTCCIPWQWESGQVRFLRYLLGPWFLSN